MKRERAAVLRPEACRRLLLAKKAELLANLGADELSLAALGRIAPEDEAPILHDQFVSLQVKILDDLTLKQIDAALYRVANGGFGICASCGEAISPKRLDAIPWAHCCIRCQERIASVNETTEVRVA